MACIGMEAQGIPFRQVVSVVYWQQKQGKEVGQAWPCPALGHAAHLLETREVLGVMAGREQEIMSPARV